MLFGVDKNVMPDVKYSKEIQMAKNGSDLDWMHGVSLPFAKLPKGLCGAMTACKLLPSEMAVVVFLIEHYPKGDWTDVQMGNRLGLDARTISKSVKRLAQAGLVSVFKKRKRDGLSLKIISILPFREAFVEWKNKQSEMEDELMDLHPLKTVPPLVIPCHPTLGKNKGTTSAQLTKKLAMNRPEHEQSEEQDEPEVTEASLPVKVKELNEEELFWESMPKADGASIEALKRTFGLLDKK